MTVELIIIGENIIVRTPFDAGFIKKARALAGMWRGEAWEFPASQEDRVRELCHTTFGTDGSPVATVTLRVTATANISVIRDSFRIGGRTIAWATARYSGARLGRYIVHLSGRIDSGGSRKYWTTEIAAGSVFEILKFPKPAAEIAAAGNAEDYRCEIVGHDPDPNDADASGAEPSC